MPSSRHQYAYDKIIHNHVPSKRLKTKSIHIDSVIQWNVFYLVNMGGL